jgi:hypothetical protein
MGKKKRKKIFQTPEERAAWEAHSAETMERLNYYIDRIKAELAAAKEKPAPQ